MVYDPTSFDVRQAKDLSAAFAKIRALEKRVSDLESAAADGGTGTEAGTETGTETAAEG